MASAKILDADVAVGRPHSTVQLEVFGVYGSYAELLTPLEAEHLAQQLRDAAARVRGQVRQAFKARIVKP